MRDLWRGVAAASALAGALIVAVLLGGQLRQFADVLRVAAPVVDAPRLLADALLVLSEAVVPLLPLVACGLAYGRLRQERGLVALAALGVRPGHLLGPALALGTLAGLVAAVVGHQLAPPAAGRLAETLVDGLLGAATGRAGPVRMPGRMLVAPDAEAVWLVWPEPEGATVMRAQRAHVDEAALELVDVAVWRPGLQLHLGRASIALRPGAWRRRLRQFAAPNALRTAALDPTDRHHQFTRYRRWAFALLAPLWALWGACLGLGWGAAWGTTLGAATVGVAYGVLRTGELSARAGFMHPALAAWAPGLLLLCALLLLVPRALARVEPR